MQKTSTKGVHDKGRKGDPLGILQEIEISQAQKNIIRTNYYEAKTDHLQKNSKCRLCSDGDEMVNHIISKCSK